MNGKWPMENGPFTDGLPIKNCDFPWPMLNNQMVCFIFWGLSIHQTFHNAKKRGFDQQKW
jgi:hypothetical protein